MTTFAEDLPSVARILRYEVPVDGQWHTVRLPGPIVHVATGTGNVVEVWSSTYGFGAYDVDLLVVGTGHPYPTAGYVQHVGTAIVPGGELVWHLLRRGADRQVR